MATTQVQQQQLVLQTRNEQNRQYLTTHYTNLYTTSIHKLQSIFIPTTDTNTNANVVYYDSTLQSSQSIENDKRYGITLIVRPSSSSSASSSPSPDVFTSIQSFLSHLHEQVTTTATATVSTTSDSEDIPLLYLYPNEDLHMTLLSIIPCHTTFSLDQICIQDYIETIDKVLSSSSSRGKGKKIKIHLKGITASLSCVMIQGFVIEEEASAKEDGETEKHCDSELNTNTAWKGNSNSAFSSGNSDNIVNDIRNQLRKVFQEERSDLLLQPIDLRYTLTTAHFTVARLVKPFPNEETLQAYLTVLEKYRDVDFGVFTIDTVDLVANDWYMLTSKLKLLHRFTL